MSLRERRAWVWATLKVDCSAHNGSFLLIEPQHFGAFDELSLASTRAVDQMEVGF